MDEPGAAGSESLQALIPAQEIPAQVTQEHPALGAAGTEQGVSSQKLLVPFLGIQLTSGH